MTPLDCALALAAEGHLVFFCNGDKRPTCPHGFKDASKDPAVVRDLYCQYPGPLVAVPTGETIDILDLDRKHAAATEWWLRHRGRMPKTRTHRTGSGGLHLVFQRHEGLRNWTSWPVQGVDCRAAGGYVIWWPAAGRPVLDDAPPAAWPGWLIELRLNSSNSFISSPNKYVPPSTAGIAADRYAMAALTSAITNVSSAGEGTRNHVLNAEAYGLARLVSAGLLNGQEVADALAAAAIGAGLSHHEIIATLRSAFRARGE